MFLKPPCDHGQNNKRGIRDRNKDVGILTPPSLPSHHISTTFGWQFLINICLLRIEQQYLPPGLARQMILYLNCSE